MVVRVMVLTIVVAALVGNILEFVQSVLTWTWNDRNTSVLIMIRLSAFK